MSTNNIKLKCQIFTPADYVKELLDIIEYNEDIFSETVLENSCGDGNILLEVVDRYIKNGMNLGKSIEEISRGLSENIYGFEIDSVQYNKCISKLNALIVSYGLPKVKWNIYNKDFLQCNLNIKFDYVIGNPPYITYKEIPDIERQFIRTNFVSCKKGKFDYCYAFIEKSVNLLSETGKMSYLVPSSIFKTVFGNQLRLIIKDYVSCIKDYKDNNIFDNAIIKSSILVLDRAKETKFLSYISANRDDIRVINKTRLGDKWIFTNLINCGDSRFGDYFKVSHVVATLLNKAFVINLDNCKDEREYYQIGEHIIEKEIVKDTATPKSKRYCRNEKIIFPYSYKNGKIKHLDEFELKNFFPGAFRYLKSFYSELIKRKSDKKVAWFEYGRTQALGNLNQNKLLISTVITDEILIYTLDKSCIPYAGLYITPRKNRQKYSLKDAKNILEDLSFLNYAKQTGIPINGNSVRITSKDIEAYRF